jgi:hypothetical protein
LKFSRDTEKNKGRVYEEQHSVQHAMLFIPQGQTYRAPGMNKIDVWSCREFGQMLSNTRAIKWQLTLSRSRLNSPENAAISFLCATYFQRQNAIANIMPHHYSLSSL